MKQNWANRLSLKSPRHQRFYFFYLWNLGVFGSNVATNDWQEQAQHVLGFFDDINQGDNVKDQMFSEMTSKFEILNLKQEEFNWLDKNNPRLCYFAWGFCRSLIRKPYNLNSPPAVFEDRFYLDYGITNQGHECFKTNFNLLPTSVEDCIDAVICFVDQLNEQLVGKKQLMERIRATWMDQFHEKHKIYKHLKRDYEQHGVWMWNYLCKKLEINTNFVRPISDKQKFDLAQLAIDIWNVHPDSKIIFLDKMYSALYSSPLFSNVEDGAGASFWLGKHEVRKLKELASKRGLQEKDYLKELIDKEHSKI